MFRRDLGEDRRGAGGGAELRGRGLAACLPAAMRAREAPTRLPGFRPRESAAAAAEPGSFWMSWCAMYWLLSQIRRFPSRPAPVQCEADAALKLAS